MSGIWLQVGLVLVLVTLLANSSGCGGLLGVPPAC